VQFIFESMGKGWMYILKCSDDSYYTGSTNNLYLRLLQHQLGEGANHTKKRLPVELVYVEEYMRVDNAFRREKQVQGWSRRKKEALINGAEELLPLLAKAYRDVKQLAVLSGKDSPVSEEPAVGFGSLSQLQGDSKKEDSNHNSSKVRIGSRRNP